MTGALQALLCATAAAADNNGTASLINRTISHSGDGSAAISLGFKVDNNGSAYKVTTTNSLLEQWLDSGVAGDFEVRATVQSGATPTGSSLNTWLACSTDRTWSVSCAAGATATCKLLIELRDASTQTLIDTATITYDLTNASTGGGGGGGGTVSIDDRIITNEGAGGAVSASYKLDNDGNAYDHTIAALETWLDSGAAGDFEARATIQTGTLSSGTTGSWLLLSTDRSWTVSAGSGAIVSCKLLVEIRDKTSLTVLDSAVIDLIADNTGAA